MLALTLTQAIHYMLYLFSFPSLMVVELVGLTFAKGGLWSLPLAVLILLASAAIAAWRSHRRRGALTPPELPAGYRSSMMPTDERDGGGMSLSVYHELGICIVMIPGVLSVFLWSSRLVSLVNGLYSVEDISRDPSVVVGVPMFIGAWGLLSVIFHSTTNTGRLRVLLGATVSVLSAFVLFWVANGGVALQWYLHHPKPGVHAETLPDHIGYFLAQMSEAAGHSPYILNWATWLPRWLMLYAFALLVTAVSVASKVVRTAPRGGKT